MATNVVNRRKCFTYIWKLENARYCWQKNEEFLESPAFIVDELQASLWTLRFYPRFGDRGDQVALALRRKTDETMIDVDISHKIAILAEDGTVLHEISSARHTFGTNSVVGKFCFYEREKVFPTRRILGNFRETFTARCEIWKTPGEMSEDVQCLGRTRIGVEKRSFIWKIGDLNALDFKRVYKIKSVRNNKNRELMTLCLFPKNNQCNKLSIFSKNRRIRYSTFQLSSVDETGNTFQVLKDEIRFDSVKSKDISFETKKFMSKSNASLSNGVLTLKCKVAISFDVVLEEIEGISLDYRIFESDDLETNISGNFFVSKEVLQESFISLIEQHNEPLGLKNVTVDIIQSVINNGHLLDINLRTNNRIFPVHKFILSARSPVFKAMFSAGKDLEKDGFIDIKDLDDDTVSRLLLYIYTSKVERLEWESAVDLLLGANKYQIFALKNICSNYLKSNLSHFNACQALVLADAQKDEDLKIFVRDYILKYAKSIMSSKNWEHLMTANLQLAAETMHFKYIE